MLQHAAWYFLNPGLPIAAAAKTLCMPSAPATPEQHFSADLVLRFVLTLQRRAQAMLPNDELPRALTQTLRQWPLSGVLADIMDPPLTAVDFGAHPGLNFLYAERLAAQERPAGSRAALACNTLNSSGVSSARMYQCCRRCKKWPRNFRGNMSDSVVERLHQEVIAPLQQRFVGRDEIVDLIALTVVAGEHLFLHGPPGTAKSALIRTFAQPSRGATSSTC